MSFWSALNNLTYYIELFMLKQNTLFWINVENVFL